MSLSTGTGDLEEAVAPSAAPAASGAAHDPLREIVDAIDVAVFRRVLRADGRIEYAYLSAGAAGVFRRPAEQVQALGDGVGIAGLIHPDDRDAWRAAFERSAQTLEPFGIELRGVSPEGEIHWIHASARPRRERGGEVIWDGVASDVTQRKQAEQERARLASIVEASGDAIYSWTMDGTIISWNPEAERLFGYAAADAIGRSFRMLVPPERDISADTVLAELAGGRTFRQFETVRLRRDGRRLDVSLTVSPLSDEAGRIVAVSTIARDIGRRRAAEAALRLAEERFRTTLSSIGDGVVATDREARVSFLNPVAEQLTGWSAADAAGRPLAEVVRLVGEDSRAPVENPVERVFAEGRIVGLANHTLLVRRDGSEVPIADSAAPILDAAGEVVGAVLVFRDVTDERAHEAHRELLVRELDHRVKNTLALVQSIVRQTARGSATAAALSGALEGRLQALASAHSLLVRSGWRDAGVEELVRDVLAPHLGDDARRLVATGPRLRLSPASVSTIGMVLHELGTNAAKYGALSVPGGHVEVEWRPAEGPEPGDGSGDEACGEPGVEICWRERGGPPVSPPERKGFGSTMIERAVVHQLRGKAETAYEPEGLVCRLVLPAGAGAADEVSPPEA